MRLNASSRASLTPSVPPVPPCVRSHDRGLRRTLPALLGAFGLALAGCGGGGAGGPSGPKFVLPDASLTQSIGAPVRIDVQGFEPGAKVVLSLDTDGDVSTSADRVVLGPDFVASASGKVVGFVSPKLIGPGTYRLVATSVTSVAVSSAPLTLTSNEFAVLVEGAQSQQIQHVAALADGRIALVGDEYGEFVASTATGPVETPATDGSDLLVAVLDANGAYSSAWTVAGPEYEAAYDLAAQPDGGFTLVGIHGEGISSAIGAIPGSPTYSVVAPKGDGWGAFAAGYTADGSLVRLDGALPPAKPPTDGYGTSFTAVAVQPDGRRLIGWTGSGVVNFGDSGSLNFGAVGAAIVRVGPSEIPESMFLVASGFVEIWAIAVRDDGGLVVAGSRWGPATYGPGTAGLVAKPDAASTLFVARFTADGGLVSLYEPTSTVATDAYGIALRPDGGVFVVGTVSGVATFAPGIVIDASGHDSFGFLARLDADLVPLFAYPWYSQGDGIMDAESSATCVSVVAMPDGGCIVGATSRYQMSFDGSSVGTGTGEQFDSIVSRHNANGDYVFELYLTGPSDQRVTDVAIDATGAVLIVGCTYGPMTITDGFGASIVRIPNLADGTAGFVVRVDADGLLR